MKPRITIVCGAYGSGKTEFAIGHALDLAGEKRGKTALIDLDIVNPYFRSRDIAAELAEQGVTVISTEQGHENSDLPALSPRIFAAFQDEAYQVVIDVGGDPNGARALGRFHGYFLKEQYAFNIVINPYRPNTRNVEDTLQLIRDLSVTSRLQPERQSRLPVVCHMVEENFLARHREFFTDFPVYPIHLRMLTPWLKEE